MKEQWFLDLDGTRSGPYTTHEITQLITAGDILPHHQIATELKGKEWKTILEWQLNFKRDQRASQSVPIPVSTPEPEPEPITSPTPVLAPTPTLTPIPAKRDPTAEMFDLLQTTKQKRTEAQSVQAQPPSPTQPAKIRQPSQLGKTILYGAVITLMGFALGQLIQHWNASPPAPEHASEPASESPQALSVAQPTEPEPQQDRSTDKITIRAPAPPPIPAPESQELQDLKKELRELKELKDSQPTSAPTEPETHFVPPHEGMEEKTEEGVNPHLPNPSNENDDANNTEDRSVHY